MIVIADTGPVNYLVIIQHADLLPRLFGQVFVPSAVWDELNDPDSPAVVRTWLAQCPSWLQVRTLQSPPDLHSSDLDQGEREAIALAEELHADEILVDELSARKEASRRKLSFIGTLGILRRAARLDMIDLPSALAQLQQTSFYVSAELIQSLLDEESRRRNGAEGQ